MSFEIYTEGRIVTREPRVTLLKHGIFNLNTGSMRIFKEQAVSHVLLMYDKETNRVAFKPCGSDTKGAYRLRTVKGIGQVSGGSFLKFYNIPHGEKTRSYPAVWNSEQGMLIINLG